MFSERQLIWRVGNELGVRIGLGEDEMLWKQSDGALNAMLKILGCVVGAIESGLGLGVSETLFPLEVHILGGLGWEV